MSIDKFVSSMLRRVDTMIDSDVNHIIKFVPELLLHNRYFKLFDFETATNLLSQWIMNNYDGRAEMNSVVRIDNKPVGYISCKVQKDKLYIDLIAVHQDYQHNGIGESLLNYAVKYANENKLDLLVKTQFDNYTALNFYIKNHFRLCSHYYILNRVYKG